MKFLIHLLNFLLILVTIFPGIIIFIFDKIPGIKRMKSNEKYSLALSIVTLINAIVFNNIILVLSTIVCVIIPYGFEYLFNEGKKVCKNSVMFEINSIKLPFFVMIFCPIFEEYIYRCFIYKHIMGIVDVEWGFVLISILAVVFCHFVNQQEKSIYKIPLGLIECIMFIWTSNIYMCIVIHMAYNILVYAHNSQKYMRSFNM